MGPSPSRSTPRTALRRSWLIGTGRAPERGIRPRRRVEAHPPVVREERLHPGVGIEVGDRPLARAAVIGAWGEADRHARRDAAEPQQEGHGTGELLAVAGLGLEEEALE